MNSTSDYKVSLGKIARTIIYEDSNGMFRFGLDFDTSAGQNILILERPVEAIKKVGSIEDTVLRTAEESRINLAFERTRQHLIKQGHQVKIWPDEFE